MVEVPGTEQMIPTQLVLLAMGFVRPVATVLDGFGVARDARGNKGERRGEGRLPDERRQGVRRRRHAAWPVAGGVGHPQGRQAARAIDEFLTGSSDLPR